MTRADIAHLAAETLSGHLGRCRRCRDGCGCPHCRPLPNALCPRGVALRDASLAASAAAERVAD